MMQAEKKSRVAFMSTLDREVYPMKVPPTRFGNALNPIKGAANRGPGCYNNEEVSNFDHIIKTKINSSKGYVLGARTAPRMAKTIHFLTPDPTNYQTTCTDPRLFEPAYKPFSAAADRFPVYKADVEDVIPGPGTYEHHIPRNRKVTRHQSFGGPPIDLPSINQHSTIDKNTEKLLSTKEEKKYHRKLAYLKLYYE